MGFEFQKKKRGWRSNKINLKVCLCKGPINKSKNHPFHRNCFLLVLVVLTDASLAVAYFIYYLMWLSLSHSFQSQISLPNIFIGDSLWCLFVRVFEPKILLCFIFVHPYLRVMFWHRSKEKRLGQWTKLQWLWEHCRWIVESESIGRACVLLDFSATSH